MNCPFDRRLCSGIEVVITALTRNQVYPQGYRGFESHPLRQLRNSRHRSVSGFAENCTMAGISSLPAPIRFAGFGAGERTCGSVFLGLWEGTMWGFSVKWAGNRSFVGFWACFVGVNCDIVSKLGLFCRLCASHTDSGAEFFLCFEGVWVWRISDCFPLRTA